MNRVVICIYSRAALADDRFQLHGTALRAGSGDPCIVCAGM